MAEKVRNYRRPREYVPVEEKLSSDLKSDTSIQNPYPFIRHILKCVILTSLLFILLEKISRKYDIFRVESNYESGIETIHPEVDEKHNLTLLCEQDSEITNKLGGFELLREDIVNMKQMIIKLGEQLRERRRFECITKKEFSRIEDRVKKFLEESGTVDEKIKNALHTYEADKVALFDYAANYAGGNIVSLLDTIPAPTNKISKFLGFFKLARDSSPSQMLNPSNLPGECFTFLGDKARIIIRLGKPIFIGSVSMEHSFFVEDISSAPKDFRVYGLKDSTDISKKLLGTFTYEVVNKRSLQTFQVATVVKSPEQYEFILLEILNNHGNRERTSIYRFRVHSV
ncbi:hypothetical protein WA026_009657 [Henosepilachna vigintioctopunctata]|uniref:SUN domain-containing protein n=1 Tax=Henosepilachna vigintioctopunctata TaxID=420089 RepID=A0AAW1U6U2_9CUCU